MHGQSTYIGEGITSKVWPGLFWPFSIRNHKKWLKCDDAKCTFINIYICLYLKAVPSPRSLSDVKTRVMDVTLDNLALLAHYLGYAWCAGCRAQYVGEDFRRRADSWEADKKGPCNGYKSDHRLKLHYKHFSFGIKNIKYGKAVIQSLVPQTYDSGPVRNPDPHPLTTTITREVSSTRSVTHTTTSSWSNSHELGVTIGYQPPETGMS